MADSFRRRSRNHEHPLCGGARAVVGSFCRRLSSLFQLPFGHLWPPSRAHYATRHPRLVACAIKSFGDGLGNERYVDKIPTTMLAPVSDLYGSVRSTLTDRSRVLWSSEYPSDHLINNVLRGISSLIFQSIFFARVGETSDEIVGNIRKNECYSKSKHF